MKTKAGTTPGHDTRDNNRDMAVSFIVTLYVTLSAFLPSLCLTKSNKVKHLFNSI